MKNTPKAQAIHEATLVSLYTGLWLNPEAAFSFGPGAWADPPMAVSIETTAMNSKNRNPMSKIIAFVRKYISFGTYDSSKQSWGKSLLPCFCMFQVEIMKRTFLYSTFGQDYQF